MPKYSFNVPEDLDGFRLDKAVVISLESNVNKISRSKIQKAIKEHNLSINSVIISNLSVRVNKNDNIEIIIHDKEEKELRANNIPIDVIYEDEELIIINKSSSMTTHPGSGNHDDTLVNALIYHNKQLSDIGGIDRPGIVHRLDKNTSGLMVIAKTNVAHINLSEQIAARALKRKYLALVWGMLTPQDGKITTQIAKNKHDRTKMTIVKSGGKEAVTYYKTLEIFKNGIFSLLECRLETGRTHQIRVQLSHLGHSIVGDQKYGNNKRKISNLGLEFKNNISGFMHQALHSCYIGFIHPKTGAFMEFNKDIPEDYNNLLKILR